MILSINCHSKISDIDPIEIFHRKDAKAQRKINLFNFIFIDISFASLRLCID